MTIETSGATVAASFLPILDTALDAVIIMDVAGVVVGWNQVAIDTFGWSAADAIGRPLAELIVPSKHRAAHSAGLARHRETGEARVLNRRIEITAQNRDLVEFPVELSITTASVGEEMYFVGYVRDITERRAAEWALRESEGYVRLLLDSTAEGFYAVDREGITTLCNPSFLRMLGFADESEAVGRKLHDVIHHSHPDGSHYPKEHCPIYRCAQDGTSAHVLDEYFYRLDGSPLPVEYWVHPILREGVLQGAICTFLDLSERVEAQAAADEAHAAADAAAHRNAAILAQLAEGVIVADERGRLTFVNDSAARLHGVAQLDVEPDEYSATYHLFTEQGEAYPPAELPLARAVRGEEVHEARWRVQRPDGSWVLAVGSAKPVVDSGGAQVGAVLTVRDESARAEAERQLRESEARLRTLTDNLPGGVVYQILTGTDGTDRKFLYVSQSHQQLTGVPAEAVLVDAAVAYELIHPEDRASMAQAEGEALRDSSQFDVQVRICRTDGEVRWCRILSAPRPQPDGSIIWDGLQIDVTDRVAAEAALQELNHTLERRVEERTRERDRAWKNSRDLQVVVDATGTFQAANEAWSSILGWAPDEVVGRHHFDFIHPEDQPSSEQARETASQSELAAFENRCLHKDGTYRWISWVAAPEDGLVYASGRHITAEKEAAAALASLEDQLRQSQKMEAVGQLTGGIAHDFNNMLAVVIGSLDLLGRRLGGGDARVRRYLDAATDGARRAAVLTQRLLAFSRQQPLTPEPININRLVSGMSELLRGSLGSDVVLETVLAAGAWRVHADPNQLENVILNLAVNGRDAMPGGGRLTIETQNAHLDARYVAGHQGVAPGQYVLIAVTDTGTGMDEEIIAKAFDPFFTTKGAGKGTGLGLSQVYGFIKQSGGHVKIYSERDQGTTVKIYLPRLIGPDYEEAANTYLSDVPLGETGEVILVVDDEAAVQAFTVDALTELGYRVLAADGAAAALRLLDTHPDIVLMFTDIVMPEVNGAKLAEEARRRRPELKVLFTTGYTRDAVVHNGVVDSGVELIGKPFAVEELAAKVRSVIDRPDGFGGP